MTEYSISIRNESKGRVGNNYTEIEGSGYVRSNNEELINALSDIGSSVDHSVDIVAENLKRVRK